MAIQGDIFSMFGLIDESMEKKKKEQEEKLQKKQEDIKKKVEAAAKKETAKKEKKEPDKFEVNEDTVIRYYGESIEIATYFDAEELAEGILINKKGGETERKPIDGEIVRKRMEKDFPELVKDFTEMVFIKEKNIIIPMIKAKKKGCSNMETPTNVGVSSTLPKIPFKILLQFISIAKTFGEYGLEIHGDVYFDKTRGYFIDIPKQRVHRLWTEVNENSIDILNRIGEDSIKVMEIHSHHKMEPIPSLQDNESERVPGMLYCIIGNTQKMFPDIYVRMFISEQIEHIKIEPFAIFQNPFTDLPEFDIEGIEVISG